MKVPVSWLRDYVPLRCRSTSSRQAGRQRGRGRGRSSRAGRSTRTGISASSSSAVVEAGKHPNADRLQLCQVDVGEGEPRQIVCGAWNFGAGATVAVALPGAMLPAGRPLGEAKLRGEISRGMILAERELELAPTTAGSWFSRAEPGTPLADVLPLADVVMEIEPTGNGPICSPSTASRARWRRCSASSSPRRRASTPSRAATESVEVGVEDLEGCPRYIGRLFRDADRALAGLAEGAAHRSGDAGDLERRRRHELRDARARQPAPRLRPASLAGDRIVVRRAARGEKLRTLDGVERELDGRTS